MISPPSHFSAPPSSPTPAPAFPAASAEPQAGRLVLGAAAVLYLISVIRFGWASDDGFITARSIHNLLSGYGFGANPFYRVQAYTSPLWMLLCLPLQAATGSPYAALLLAGLGCSLAFTVVIVRAFRERPWPGAAVLAAASASTCFLTFSTSGLENPLAHLLLVLFCLARLRRGPRVGRETFLLAALIFLTRFDYLLLIAPPIAAALIAEFRTSGRKQLADVARRALAFVVPVGLWLAFATIYYGFPLPNTAYAKLNSSIPLHARLAQGLAYLVDAVYRDPALVLFPLLAMVPVLVSRARREAQLLLAGVWLYLGYVVWIGGDFMGGRFVTAAFVVSLVVAAHEAAPELLSVWRWAAAAAFLVGLPNLADRRVDRGTECSVPDTGIVDERGCYVEHTGLAVNIRHEKWRAHNYLTVFRKMVAAAPGDLLVFDLVGMAPFGDPRPVHVVEPYALTEPLLARIRFAATSDWRPGHLRREIPAGYIDTLRTGTNTIVDPCLHRLHDRLSLVTTGPLFSARRLATIAALNFGGSTCPAPER